MQNSEIYALFAKRKKRQNWISALIVIIVIGMVPFRNFASTVPMPYQSILVWGATIFIIALIVLSIANWRCPNCGMWFGRETNMVFCKHCGIRLKEFYD
jgi:hypothetical protein